MNLTEIAPVGDIRSFDAVRQKIDATFPLKLRARGVAKFVPDGQHALISDGGVVALYGTASGQKKYGR